MNLRFYIDSTSGLPHIYNHDVNEDEVDQALANRGEDRPGDKGSRIATGQTDAGRYLRVIYVRDPKPDSVFVITAYELSGKPLKAYRRRIDSHSVTSLRSAKKSSKKVDIMILCGRLGILPGKVVMP